MAWYNGHQCRQCHVLLPGGTAHHAEKPAWENYQHVLSGRCFRFRCPYTLFGLQSGYYRAKSLSGEVADHGINVNCIAPGIIRTPMTARYTSEQVANFMGKIPMGRFGEPDDVAKVIEFLASDGSDYLTGQVYNVTGGWLMVS